MHLALHDLTDLPVNLSVVSVVASHRDTPNEQPDATGWYAQQQVQDVVRVLLLAGEYKQLFVHGASLSGANRVSNENTNVSLGVSSVGVFTIRIHPAIIRVCSQIRI